MILINKNRDACNLDMLKEIRQVPPLSEKMKIFHLRR